MKKALLTLCLAITISFSFSQQIINLTPSDNIQTVIDTLTMQDAVVINLGPGIYNGPITITGITTTSLNNLIIQSADINNMATITDPANNVINIGVGFVQLKALNINSDMGSSVAIFDNFIDISQVTIDSCKLEGNHMPVIYFDISTTTSNLFNNFYITNNEIVNGEKAIYFSDYYGATSNVIIQNNFIHSQKYVGIYLSGITDIKVL